MTRPGARGRAREALHPGSQSPASSFRIWALHLTRTRAPAPKEKGLPLPRPQEARQLRVTFRNGAVRPGR